MSSRRATSCSSFASQQRGRDSNPRLTLVNVTLTSVYSLVAGLAVGVLVIRVDLLLSGSGGRRAAREEEAAALRPEAGRTQPLL